jgi:hypothetical protein
MEKKTSIAVFDPEALYPFRALVKGPLTTLADLEAIVLHDEMVMEVQRSKVVAVRLTSLRAKAKSPF